MSPRRGQLLLAVVASLAGGQAALAQIIPGRTPGRPTAAQPARRDTTKDTTTIKWPEPDSVARRLLERQGYTTTRYQGDTAFFNAQRRALDLLAAKGQRAIVDRDSQIVVSDSGIYYSEATRDVQTGGHYILSSPGSGQADIKGHGRANYQLTERSITVTNAHLPVNYGEVWFMSSEIAKVIADTTQARKFTTYSGRGTLTSCEDSIPDYHFEFNEAKRTSENTIVAAPAVLYIRDIPVLWLPFLFSDTRPGRHSGILAPQFGFTDIVRNSSSYRRHVDRAGYYWAINDYMGAAAWLDWRSTAGAREGDPGWLREHAVWDYKWIDRFLAGNIGADYEQRSDGPTNLSLRWQHAQDFSHNSHLTTDLNYATSTTIQRESTFDPVAAIATIASAATFSNKLGPASFQIGGTRKQYPGRIQVDQTFPTVSINTTPIGWGDWFSWTPSMSYNRSDVINMDQPGLGSLIFRQNPVTGVFDSIPAKGRGSTNTDFTFNTPIQIFGRDLKNSFHIAGQRNNFPQQIAIYDLNTGAIIENRVFATTFRNTIDWTPEFTLPAIARNRFNLTPSISLQNVDPNPFWIASERTNGRFVHQSKRLSYGLSASPTLFGLFDGFGPFERIRHSITPSISYSYAPASTVSDDYLRALGRTRAGYLGNLRQNAITFGLTQNVEAKIRPRVPDTTGTAKPDIIRLITLNTQSISYDFERAHAPGVHSRYAGITTETWGYSLTTDLIPGFDFSSTYSLFEGNPISDTARFSPYLTSVSASLNIGRDQNPLAVLTRLFGRAVPQAQVSPNPSPDRPNPRPDDTLAAVIAARPVAGQPQSGDRFIIPPSQGWHAQFQLSHSSPRPPRGPNVIIYDPRERCRMQAAGDQRIFDACIANLLAQPTNEQPVPPTIEGTALPLIPPTTSMNVNLAFNLTQKWATTWSTTYDIQRHEFASQNMSLQRELHDWRAIFGFTQSPNGNFAFRFTIALIAEPDLKFDYNRSTVRTGASF